MCRADAKHLIALRRSGQAAAALLLIALTACNTTATGTAPPTAAARVAASADVDMVGRWVLASPNAGFCNMTFSGKPGSVEGAIAPEGGCPGNFFTSRKWAFEQSALVIRNHKGEPLAQLSAAGPTRLEGQATSGEQITLTR
jgi:hypothetical protein